jgi:geranylgeranyl pyrophosphate synthase
LCSLLGTDGTGAEEIAVSWLAKSGKRWRPVLAACAYRALTGNGPGVPDSMKKLAVAVECFHKASLVHDDIEDNDDFRYGDKTLHRQHGIPIALNVGDLLLGEGYRLIAASEVSPDQKARMLAVAAGAHRALCIGQGQELSWMAEPGPLSSREILDLFRHKTAPAFEVALRLGAVCAGADDKVCAVLKRYSESLGIAYQIRDDLEDFTERGTDDDVHAMRPSLLLAVAYENADARERERLASAWGSASCASSRDAVRQAVARLGARGKVEQLFQHYQRESVRSLSDLRNGDLKQLLHRLTGRILRDL